MRCCMDFWIGVCGKPEQEGAGFRRAVLFRVASAARRKSSSLFCMVQCRAVRSRYAMCAMQGDCLSVSGPLRMLHPRLQPSGIVSDVGAFIPEEKARV